MKDGLRDTFCRACCCPAPCPMHVASHTAAPPARCSGLCEDVEVGALAAEADGLEPVAAQLSALPPDASLPVSAAVLVCMAPDGYLTAPALAAAAPALADDVRARFARLRDSARAPPEHGNSSYSRPACCSPAQNNEARKVVPNCCAELRRSSEAIGSNHRWQKGDWPHRGPLPYTLAILCSSPPCRPARVPFSAPKRDRMPEHGSIPCDEASRIPPQSMPIALRRRLRLPLPLCSSRCGPNPGCGGAMDPYGDDALACPRTGLLARRGCQSRRARLGPHGT